MLLELHWDMVPSRKPPPSVANKKTPLKARNVASESTYATEWDKKMEGYIMNGCAAIVAVATIIFFVWLFS